LRWSFATGTPLQLKASAQAFSKNQDFNHSEEGRKKDENQNRAKNLNLFKKVINLGTWWTHLPTVPSQQLISWLISECQTRKVEERMDLKVHRPGNKGGGPCIESSLPPIATPFKLYAYSVFHISGLTPDIAFYLNTRSAFQRLSV